jgi:hypothetical protein
MSANPVSKPMSLEEARQVPMMFERYQRRTIGSLLDSGELQQRDLVYAAQKGFNPILREAAQIVIKHLQSELATTRVVAPLNVISSKYRSYAEGKQFQYTFIQGLVGGLFFGFSLFLLLNRLFYPSSSDPGARERVLQSLNTPHGVLTIGLTMILLIVILLVIVFLPHWIDRQLEKRIQLFRKGQKAEERVLNSMYHTLDDSWWLFRNLEMPKKGDMDFVLVGQAGIWVFEVKAYNGEYRNRGDNWETHIGSKWISAFKNPTKQARANAMALNQFLTGKNLSYWVNPIVVWANPESTVSLEAPTIPVLTLDNLTTELRKLDSKNKLSEEKMGQVVEALKSLYDDLNHAEHQD